MMNINSNRIVKAVLDDNVEEAKRCLSEGVSPNEAHALPIIVHAARFARLEMFQLLLDHGAVLPDYLLGEAVSWELGDWIIQDDSDIDAFIAILRLIKEAGVWPSREERQTLAARIEGYGLDRIITVLLE